MVERDGVRYLLALCEGNSCAASSMGQEPGNGRILVLTHDTSDTTAMWTVRATISIPPTADFFDYSGLDVDESGRVLVTSQESAALFVGQLHASEWRFVVRAEKNIVFVC